MASAQIVRVLCPAAGGHGAGGKTRSALAGADVMRGGASPEGESSCGKAAITANVVIRVGKATVPEHGGAWTQADPGKCSAHHVPQARRNPKIYLISHDTL